MESEVTVTYRKADKAAIEKLLPDVKARYEEATKQSVKVTLLDEHLPADRYEKVVFLGDYVGFGTYSTVSFVMFNSAGGVIVAGNGGRTICNNTPEARLAILEEDVSCDFSLFLYFQYCFLELACG